MITITEITQKIQDSKRIEESENKAAILVPIITINNQLELIYQIRSKSLKWQPGDICFPGGHIEQSDLNPQAAARRETHEELGIPLDEITVIGKLPEIKATFGLHIYPFVGQIASLDNMKINTDEVENIFTVPIDWLIQNQPQQASMQVGLKPSADFPFDLVPTRSKDWQKSTEHRLYFYRYKHDVIWGLTAQITKAFIDMIVK